MLDDCRWYFNENNSIGGRHRYEILAEDFAREGLPLLSREVLWIHRALEKFRMGQFAAAKHFHEHGPIFTSLVSHASKTKYHASVVDLVEGLKSFAEPLEHCGEDGLDWPASSRVLAKVKAEFFPEDMTMVEKMAHWHSSSTGRTTP